VALKIKHQARARDWRAFLARWLYNAAKNFVRNKDLRESKMQSLETDATEDTHPAHHLCHRSGPPPPDHGIQPQSTPTNSCSARCHRTTTSIAENFATKPNFATEPEYVGREMCGMFRILLFAEDRPRL
jgi:hypothetical protein